MISADRVVELMRGTLTEDDLPRRHEMPIDALAPEFEELGSHRSCSWFLVVLKVGDIVDDPGVFERFLPVPEESGAHIVLLGGPKLLMASNCPQTHGVYAELGYEPVIIDMSEFQKLEGCVTSLSVRLRHLVT